MKKALMMLGMALAVGLGPAQACPDYDATPVFGTIDLTHGLQSTPERQEVIAGGASSLAACGFDWVGWVGDNPDYELRYQPSAGGALTIAVESDADTVLLVNGPDGQWVYDDDAGGGGGAQIVFTNAAGGTYDIFVGTYSAEPAAAVLSIFETIAGLPSPLVAGGCPDPGMAATFAVIDLTQGFSPDPYSTEVVAGGPIDLADCTRDWTGWVATAPDYKINYESTGSTALTIFLESAADTILLVNGPDGQWIYDDDAGGSGAALITFANAMSGTYDVYIGTFAAEPAPATLYVTELR